MSYIGSDKLGLNFKISLPIVITHFDMIQKEFQRI